MRVLRVMRPFLCVGAASMFFDITRPSDPRLGGGLITNSSLMLAGALGQNQHWKRFIIGARGRNWRRLSNCRLPRKPVLWPRINTSAARRGHMCDDYHAVDFSARQTPPVRPKQIRRWKRRVGFLLFRAFWHTSLTSIAHGVIDKKNSNQVE